MFEGADVHDRHGDSASQRHVSWTVRGEKDKRWGI